MTPLRLVVFGPQGAGKGTQCARLSERYGVPHIATGDMLRAAVAEGTEMGREAKRYMDAGDLLPDDVITGVVAERLDQSDAAEHGFCLDGFPRTVGQAESLRQMLAPDFIDAAIEIDVPTDVLVDRMAKRGRADDTVDAIRRRLELYDQETRPVLAWFAQHGSVAHVDGVGTEDDVEERMVKVIEAHSGTDAA